MGRGSRCRECGDTMYAQTERYEPKGTWVTYVCRNGRCESVKRGFPFSEKVFEPSR